MRLSNNRKQLFSVLLAVLLVFCLSFAAFAAEQPVLVVTGSDIVSGASAADLTKGIVNEKAYTLDELKALGISEDAVYSAINTSSTKSLFRGEGVNIAKLLALHGVAQPGVISAIAGDGYAAELNLAEKRFYFPAVGSDSADGAVEVPAVLAWAQGGKRGDLTVPAVLDAVDEGLNLLAGQLNVADMNNPLFNKGVVILQAGEELPAVLKLDGVEYARAELLLMPRTERSYTYANSDGEATDVVRGVLFADLFGTDVEDGAMLNFTCADGYDVSDLSVTYAEAKANNYMLAYELKNGDAWEGIYAVAKKGDAKGYFTLYGDGVKPCKMIDSITPGEVIATVPTTSEPEVVAPAPENDWAAEAQSFVTENGLMVGTPNGFDGDATVTRATVATILARLSGDNFAGAYHHDFWDVDPHAWYAGGIGWALDNGIAVGYTGWHFGPNDDITRAQLSVMMANYLKSLGIKLPAGEAAFTDKADIFTWAKDAVGAIQAAGIICGYPDGSFKPNATATRAELAVMLKGLCDYIAASGAEQPVLVVTGSGLAALDATVGNEKSFTLEDLKALGASQQLYSAMNSSGTKTLFLAEGISLDTLLSSLGYDGKSAISVIASDGFVSKVDFSAVRYYYPEFVSDSTANAVAVPATIAWAVGGERGKTAAPTATEELSALRLLVGQLDLADKNNSSFTDGIVKILVGEELAPCLTVAGKEYTRAEILMMPRTEGTFTYQTKGGEATVTVRGVALADLLKGYSAKDVISFTAADGYDMSAASVTMADAAKTNGLIAYEILGDDGKWQGIFDKAKSGDAVGFFTLYREGEKPSSLIDSVSVKVAEGIDYATSPFRHINNGGYPGSSPYNIDAITGSTLTIEGPGMAKSVPLSIRELENQNAGTVRAEYTDANGTFIYEGIDMWFVLYGMTAGDNGIVTTDGAYKVTLKNRNRNNIAEFTLDQIKQAHDAGTPILIAYGVGDTEGKQGVPYVFDDALGAVKSLHNEDGPIKLVYDSSSITGDMNTGYDTFLSMAYIYVSEEFTPGFKHNIAPYNNPDLAQYILTFTGEGLGRELNLTTQQIEDMVAYDAEGKLVAGGLGHRDLYSLTNTTYWYVNEYEGMKLYEMLKFLGLPADIDTATKITFEASDGYKSADSFTVAELANPDLFGYYEKAAEDVNDGKYVSKAEDLLRTGFPVLLCYGVNGYPYTISTSADGYLSGLSNNGGPFRIIFGKREYSHVNGSNQIQFVSQITVGDNPYHYSTHKYSNIEALKALTESKLTVTVKGDDGTMLKDNAVYTVGQLEDLIYGDVTKQAAKSAQDKAFYELLKNGEQYSDLYEGVDLEYFLTKIVEIPGIKGTITFANDAGKTLSIGIEDALTKGFNPQTGVQNLGAMIAFAKNGTPLVFDKSSEGFEKSYTVADGIDMTVQNSGGPLAILIPATESREAQSLINITSININLEADKYAHLSGDYEALASATLTVSGSGTTLTEAKTFTVGELEGKQSIAKTGTYSLLNSKGTVSQVRYRGLDLYEFLKSTDVGLRSNAESVIITATDGSSYTLTVSELLKKNYINSVSGASDLVIMLAYGSAAADNAVEEDGLPLVADKGDKGYVEAYDNAGGPLMLVIGQTDASDVNKSKCVKNVASIEVTASALDSWKHSVSDIYKVWNSMEFTFEVKNSDGSDSWTKTYTLEEMEAMDSIIVRDDYVWVGEHAHEGLMLWPFIMQEAGNIVGIDNPSAVTAFATDGYSKEFISIWGLDEVQNGVKDSVSGNRKHILLCYSQDGLPLVPGEGDDGYSGLSGNSDGPLRVIAHENQGACNKKVNKLVVTLNGTDKISFK